MSPHHLELASEKPACRERLGLGGLALATGGLLALGHGPTGGVSGWQLAMVGLIAFLLLGPYSYLGGAMALDFGGKHGSATACGIIDGVGYLGGVLAGESIARVSTTYGWSGAFDVLAGVAAVSTVMALLYLLHEWAARREPVVTVREAA